MKCFYKIQEQDIFYTIIANITNRCNFKCKYCCEYCNEFHNIKDLNLSYLKFFIDDVVKNIKHTGKTLKLSLYGGEPTLHSNLINFCKDIREKYNDKIYIELYSNFSAGINLYNSFLLLKVNLILTAHNSINFNMEDFYIKVTQLNKLNISDLIIFNVMFEKENCDISINLYNKLCSYCNLNNIKMKLPPLLKIVRSTTKCNYNYSNNELKTFNLILNYVNDKFLKQYVIEENGEKTFLTDSDMEKNNMCFKRWLCYSGYSSCYVNVDGKIYKCLSDFHNNLNTDFNIFKNYNVKKIMLPHMCNACLCTDYDSKKIEIFKNN